MKIIPDQKYQGKIAFLEGTFFEEWCFEAFEGQLRGKYGPVGPFREQLKLRKKQKIVWKKKCEL